MTTNKVWFSWWLHAPLCSFTDIDMCHQVRMGGSLLRSFLVSGILLVQRHTTQNQFSAFGLRYEHYIRCYWQVCSTGSCPVPLLRTALTLFVSTSWDGCIRQKLDSKVVVRVKRWPTRKKSLLILLSWLVKQRFWWAMRKVGVEEWIVRLVQAMYNNARSQVRVGCEYSEEFEVGVGVHQGSVLSPLLFIIVLEALSRDVRVGVPWELFFADDLVIIATSLEECVERVKVWKEGLESKGLHVNMTKTKFMASGLGLDILQDSGKFPCALCRTGVGRSSIQCSKCNLWVHYKKCSGLKTLSEDLSYECPRCRGVPGIRPVDGCPFKEVEVGDCVLEAVDRFCYLGDMLSAGGGCMAAATARCRCAWGKFRENLPLLTSKPVPFDLRGRLFSSNVRSSMLHGTETWPMTSAALHRLCRNDRAMIRWICGVKPSDDPSMDELHAKLGICDLAILVRERRLRWFGHVMRSNGEINRVRSRPVPGRKGPGWPKKTWEECVKQDLKVCGLSEAGTQDRLSWRSSVKNSRQEPTPSNGSLLQSMAAPPARRVLGMRTRSFNKTGFDWLIDWLRYTSSGNEGL